MRVDLSPLFKNAQSWTSVAIFIFSSISFADPYSAGEEQNIYASFPRSQTVVHIPEIVMICWIIKADQLSDLLWHYDKVSLKRVYLN